MKVPLGMTEEEVLQTINTTLNKLSHVFQFGYNDANDIRQEGLIIAIELLDSNAYDGVRPFQKFLYTHLRNRLSNLKRNKFRRNDSPCILCHQAYKENRASTCKKVTDNKFCPIYMRWVNRNNTKQRLMNMVDLDKISGYAAQDTTIDLEIEEIRSILDKELLPEHRKLWLKLLAGEKLSIHQNTLIHQQIHSILTKHNIIIP